MKAASFCYHRAGTRDEALELLSTLENARLLAGGQSLVAMLNMRYAFVDHLIDINRIADLAGIDIRNNTVVVGAMTRQCDLLRHAALAKRSPIFAEALRFVGHVHTRNRGTVGGSLAHMDPAAELLAIATLLQANIRVASAKGSRDIGIDNYPASYMTPRIEPAEMITAVSFELPKDRHGWSFDEFAQRHGDFAIAAVGTIVELSVSGTVSRARIVVSGLDFAPQRLIEAERALMGQLPSDSAAAAAAEIAGQGEAISDALAGGSYRRRLARTLTHRGLKRAFARVGVVQ